MSGVNQIKEQNEEIIARLGERQPDEERASDAQPDEGSAS